MLTLSYKSKIENELKYKQEQLSNAQLAKPQEVAKPSLEDDPNAKKAKENIEKNQEFCKTILTSLQKLNDEREAIIKLIQDITDSKVRLERFYAQITSTKNELRPLYEQNKLDIDSIMTLSFHPELIDQKINELNGRLADINNQLDEKNPEGLKYKYVHTLQQLEEIKKKLSAPELEY